MKNTTASSRIENRENGEAAPPAELVLKNGRIYTLETSPAWAQALAVSGKRIVYLGTDKGVRSHIGPDTRVIDLDKKLVLPAFVDGHMHPPYGAYRYFFCLSLFRINGEDMVKAYLEAVEAFLRAHPETKWIQGAGFRRPVFDEIGPRKEWLDALEKDRPITIISKDGHSMWVNSKALALAGITAETPDPPNGVIQRDPETGAPSGLLQEAAMDLVKPLIPKPEKEQLKKSLLLLQEWLNREGITTVHDADIEVDAPQYYEAYQELAEEGRLTVRYRASWRMHPHKDFLSDIDRALDLSSRFTSPHFKAYSFKFFADEVIEEETGYLLEPYAHRPDEWFGIKDWEDEDFKAAFTKVHQAGGQIHVHAIGDAAARYTLDALEAAQHQTGSRDRRPTMAHLQMTAPEDIDRMAALNVTAVVAPYWAVIDDYFWDLYVPYLGPDRAFNRQYPLKSFFKAGVNVALHSDFSVTEPDVMRAIYSSLTRRIPKGIFNDSLAQLPGYRWVSDSETKLEKGVIGSLPPARERMNLEEALRAATINGAYANFLEDDLGTLAVGKLADLVVLDRNLFEIEVEEIPETRVAMTLFEGRIVHESSEGTEA